MCWRWMVVICLAAVAPCSPAVPDDSVASFLKMASDEEPENAGRGEGMKSTNCSCGYTNKDSNDEARIVGGQAADVNEFPLMAGLLEEDSDIIYCGGAIITEYHVLTAGHCTSPPYSTVKKLVVVGEHNQFKKGETSSTVTIPVEKHVQHPQYKDLDLDGVLANDVSLLVLSRKIAFSDTVGPACLPTEDKNLVKEQVKIIGWGFINNHQQVSSVLKKVNMRVIPLKHCHKEFTQYIVIPMDKPQQFCVVANRKDSCHGDSGGPVLWLDPDTNRYTLVGLVSAGGVRCGESTPAINVAVAAYSDWIQESIAATKPEARTCSKTG